MEEELEYEEVDETSSDEKVNKINKLKKELINCKEEKQEYLDGWQRSQADILNIKKRSAEESSNLKNKNLFEFISDLLPLADSFEMAFKDKEAWEKAPEQWRKGVEYIFTQLENIFSGYGVERIGNIGEEFNHEIHEPMEMIEVEDEKDDHKIQEVIRTGYKIKENVIRPAHVKVGQKK